jgi:pimeloyl-ACP methyl ester carboxylesterase
MLGPALMLAGPMLGLKNVGWLSRASAKRMGIPKQEWEAFLAAARSMDAAGLKSFLNASSAFRAPARLAEVACPTLVLRGEKEAGVIKRSVPEVAALIPGARAGIAPKLSHPWPLEDPDLFVEVCRAWFLRGEVPPRLTILQ